MTIIVPYSCNCVLCSFATDIQLGGVYVGICTTTTEDVNTLLIVWHIQLTNIEWGVSVACEVGGLDRWQVRNKGWFSLYIILTNDIPLWEGCQVWKVERDCSIGLLIEVLLQCCRCLYAVKRDALQVCKLLQCSCQAVVSICNPPDIIINEFGDSVGNR